MKPLIQVAEVWVPDSDGYLLEFYDGLFGSSVEFGAISRSMCFGKGEGLPGRVWEEGRPIILKSLQGGYFRRAAAAKAAGLTCAVGMPIYFGDRLQAVMVFFCGGDNWGAGAIELWCNRAGSGDQITLVDGYYGSTADGFESGSRQTTMARGKGLPGLAWDRGAAVFLDELSSNAHFQRGEAASAAGFKHAMAVPCPVPGDETYVLTFLSSTATPIAQRMETWASGITGMALQRTFGFCEIDGNLPIGDLATASGSDGTAAEAYASAAPRVLKRSGEDPYAIGESPSVAAACGLIAFPILNQGAVSEAVVLYL